MTTSGARRHPALPAILRPLVLVAGLLVAVASASAATGLSIRLIKASNEGAGMSPALSDVAGLLQSNLPFQRFDLLDQAAMALPATGSVELAHGLSVHCSGPADNLRVTVDNGGVRAVDTTLRLAELRPVILGGFPFEQGRLLLVIVAR